MSNCTELQRELTEKPLWGNLPLWALDKQWRWSERCGLKRNWTQGKEWREDSPSACLTLWSWLVPPSHTPAVLGNASAAVLSRQHTNHTHLLSFAEVGNASEGMGMIYSLKDRKDFFTDLLVPGQLTNSSQSKAVGQLGRGVILG